MVKPTETSYRNRGVAENFSSSVATRKNDQWNVKRDIPVGTVRNNPFLPEPKQPSPQLQHQKKQWDTSNIPRGSVASRIQDSNSPRKNIGGNEPISPTKVMEGSNGRQRMFSNTSPGLNNQRKEPITLSTSSPRGFYSKVVSSSWQNKQKRSPDQKPTLQQSPQRPNEEKEIGLANRRWEPSRDIPSGTVKGRVSSLYGQSTSEGRKPKDISTSVSINANTTDYNLSVEASTKKNNAIVEGENSNDDEDQWIISERNVTNTQVFASEWGEAIPAKSAESDDWDTPAKEWIRSGESQTEVFSYNEAEQNVTENQEPSLPAEIAAPVLDNTIPQRITTPSILAPPPKDANAYHKPEGRSLMNQKSREDNNFDTKSHSSLSHAFNDNFGNFVTKSEIISIHTPFSTYDSSKQQVLNGSSDAFGFPVSSTREMVENQNIGEIVGGDEFFDASVLPNDYDRPTNDDRLPNDYDRPTNDDRLSNDYDLPTNDDRLPNDYDRPTNDNRSIELNRHSSITSTISIEDDAHDSVNDSYSGDGDSKKKRKGFFKGLFGRKGKDNGKVNPLTKGNKKLQIRKERSYSKSSLSDSSFQNLSNSQSHDPTLLNQKGRKVGVLSGSNVENPVESNQVDRLTVNPTVHTILSYSKGEIRDTGEHHLLKGKSQDDTNENIEHKKNANEFNDVFYTQNNSFKEYTDPKFSESKAVGVIISSAISDDVFDDLEPNSPASQNVEKKTVEDAFLDPELDHLDSNIDSEEESLAITGPPNMNMILLQSPPPPPPQQQRNAGQELRMTEEYTRVHQSSSDGRQSLEKSSSDFESETLLNKENPERRCESDRERNVEEETKILNTEREESSPDRRYARELGNIGGSKPVRMSEQTKLLASTERRENTQKTGVIRGTSPARNTANLQGRARKAFVNIHKSNDDRKVALTSVSRKPAATSRLNAPIHSQLSVDGGSDSTLGSNFLPNRYTKNSVFNKASSVHDTVRQDGWRGIQEQGGSYGRHIRSSRYGHDSQNAKEKTDRSNFHFHNGNQDGTNRMKFSRAAHAYNIITKKNMIEDSEDQRKYLSIPAASTSASDISCSSTYDSYQKKLADSLRKANIVTKNSSEYSLHSRKSLDDSSIESDIRVLRSILRRPRLDHNNETLITASRQIQGFPTYDTESATDPMQRAGLRLLSSAIIPIQTEVRRFLAMRHALTKMWALIVIQTYTRRFLAQKNFQKASNSAVTIQAVLRGHFARNDVIDKHICAIEIQRFVRGYLATMQVYEDIYKVTLVQSLVRMRISMDYAAYRMSLIIQVQAIARGFLARRRRAHLDYGATLIQSSWRGFYNRLTYQFDLLDIIIVQSLWRKKLGVQVAAKKIEEKRNASATLIQAEWRAYDCRMDFLCYISARTIQTKWRSHRCRMNYVDNQASTIIQSAARMFLCRLQYVDYQAAMVIQSLARRYFCQVDYAEYKCSKKIQSVVRMFLCRSQYLEYQCASKIQAVVRMFLCRYDYLEYRGATKIQSIGRMYLCRIKYTDHQAAIASRVIQTKWRAYMCRKMYIENFAATMIQAKWRSFDCSSMYKRYRSARAIQKTWRSYDCQMNFLHFLADILIVQSTIRRFLVQRKMKAMKNRAEFKAARKIQSAWRGLVCYIDYHEHLTVMKIQSAWKAFVRRRNHKREEAAIRIQCTWRGFLVYADYMFELSDIVAVQKQSRVWLAKRVANKQAKSILVIQSAWRNVQAKKLTRQMSVILEIANYSSEIAKKQSIAAIKVQRVFRGSLARVAVRLYFAVRKIQAVWRAFRPRQSYITYIAARKIQATWRRYIPRQGFVAFIAARSIQNRWRSMKANQNALLLRREFNAASLIQSVWRGFVSYTDFVFTLSDIVAAQKIARGYLSRKKYCGAIRSNIAKRKVKSNRAVAIQKIFRGFQARQNYWYTLGCTMQIQSWWRGRRVCRRIQKEANALLMLQCFARCSLARQEHMQRRFVFMLIQTAELERSKKLKVFKMKEQVREDTEEYQRDVAARVIQRFFLHVNRHEVDQLLLATKRRKEWRKKMRKENDTDDVEEALLEDVWIDLAAQSKDEEPFTRHYTNFGPGRVGNRMQKHKVSANKTILQDEAEPFAPHPTSSIRIIRKVDMIDMDDDFQLEEAFIDAEICHAKERRHYAGRSYGKKVHPRSGPSRGATRSSRKDLRISESSNGKKKSGGKKGQFNVLATMSNH